VSDEPGFYSAHEVCDLGSVTYRQLDYWDRIKLIKPSLRQAKGSGTQRLYSASDVDDVQMIKALLDAGISLNYIRKMGPDKTAQRVVQLVSQALKEHSY